jgi:hypothetical protein
MVASLDTAGSAAFAVDARGRRRLNAAEVVRHYSFEPIYRPLLVDWTICRSKQTLQVL